MNAFVFFFTFCCVGPIKNAIVKSDVSIHNCVSVNRSSPPIVPLLSHIKCTKSYQESGHPRESGQEKNSFEYIFGCQKIWHTESQDNNFDGEQQIAIWNELYFNSLSILIPNNMIFCSTITIRVLLGTSSQGCYVTLLGRCSRRYTKSRHERGVLLKSSWPCHFSCSLALLSDDLSCQMITMVYVCVFSYCSHIMFTTTRHNSLQNGITKFH